MLPSGCFMRYLISSMFITNFDNRFYWFSENMIWQRWFPGCAVTVSFPFLLCVCLNYSNLTFIYTTFSRSPIIYSLVGVARASDSFDLQSISMSASVFGSLRLFFFFAFAHWLFSSPLDHYNNHHHHYFRGRSLCFGRFGSIRKGDFLILCVILQSSIKIVFRRTNSRSLRVRKSLPSRETDKLPKVRLRCCRDRIVRSVAFQKDSYIFDISRSRGAARQTASALSPFHTQDLSKWCVIIGFSVQFPYDEGGGRGRV